MSRSQHVTQEQLRKERVENTVLGLTCQTMTELEVKDLKKRASKINSAWSRQARKVELKADRRIRVKDGKVEVV
jgi:hypothetical protein